MNAVESVQEIVEITVGSGAAKSVWPSRKKGVERTKLTRTEKLEAANGNPIRVEGDGRLEFIRDEINCRMKFLDADVKRPLASVSATVDEGNVVVFGQHESFIGTDERLDARPGSVGFGEVNTNERTSVFRRLA